MQQLLNLIRTDRTTLVQGRVKNAISPLLWLAPSLVGPLVPLVWLSAKYANPTFTMLLIGAAFCLAAVILGAALKAYFHFMENDPDRLQSEEFQSFRQALQVMAQKGEPTRAIDPTEAVENPALDHESR